MGVVLQQYCYYFVLACYGYPVYSLDTTNKIYILKQDWVFEMGGFLS